MKRFGFTKAQFAFLAVMATVICAFMICGGYLIWTTALAPTPLPPAPPTPTEAPPVSEAVPLPLTPTPAIIDTSWSDVQQAGKLVVGTSADYPPFEYYTANFQLDGFDMALIRQIGERLGVQVEINNLAFDGLPGAMLLGQIDAAIAAISVTPERQGLVLFSNVYLVSQDGVLARQDASVANIAGLSAMKDKRVGVQHLSVYERGLKTELVDTGLMPPGNLHAYSDIEIAVADLKNDVLDLVMLDLLPAQQFLNQGGLKLAGQGLYPQEYAIMLRPGDLALQAEINRALVQLYNEGLLSQLAQRYLGTKPEQNVPLPTPAPVKTPPQPTATPPGFCLDGMAFVRELSYPDFGMTAPPIFVPGMPFQKGWRIRNTGTCTWNDRYLLTYLEGNSPLSSMGGSPTRITSLVPPGAEYDLYINLVSPLYPGVYQGFWQLRNGNSVPFGERLGVGIVVAPMFPTTPTPAPGSPVIYRFDLIPNDQVILSQCVDLYWETRGDVTDVRLYRNETVLREDAPVNGSARDCPPQLGQMVYKLEALGPGGTASASDQVQVIKGTVPTQPPEPSPTLPAPPLIEAFEVTPPQVVVNQCVNMSWSVEGAGGLIQIIRNNDVILDNASDQGTAVDCLSQVGEVLYRIEAANTAGQKAAEERSVTVVNSQVDPDLVDRAWQLASYANSEGKKVDVLPGTSLTALFSADGSLAGSTGCNTYTSRYDVIGSSLHIDPPTVTRQVCTQPPGVMEQEAAFLSALQAAGRYLVTDNRLELFDASGKTVLLTFVAQR